jgi:hypothetical protein
MATALHSLMILRETGRWMTIKEVVLEIFRRESVKYGTIPITDDNERREHG